MSNRDIGIRHLIPGVRFPDEIKEDENNRRYVETVINRSTQVNPREEPLGETLMRTAPSLHLELKPKVETKETPENLDKVLIEQAKRSEMARKARQDPDFVAQHNERFPRFKTTVLPKDKGPNEKTVQQLRTLKNWGLSKPKASPIQSKKLHQRLGTKSEKWIDNPKKLDAFIKSEDPNKRVNNVLNKYEDDHPYLKGIEEDLEEIDKKGKSWFSKHLKKTQPTPKPMPVLTYVDKMNVAYSGQEKRKYDDQGKPIDTSKGYYIPWYDRMAGEEADHLNSIKRQTWKAGGSVGPEPKYVSAQDVKSVYDKK